MPWWWVHRKFSSGDVVSLMVQARTSGEATILTMNNPLVESCRRVSRCSEIYTRLAR